MLWVLVDRQSMKRAALGCAWQTQIYQGNTLPYLKGQKLTQAPPHVSIAAHLATQRSCVVVCYAKSMATSNFRHQCQRSPGFRVAPTGWDSSDHRSYTVSPARPAQEPSCSRHRGLAQVVRPQPHHLEEAPPEGALYYPSS